MRLYNCLDDMIQSIILTNAAFHKSTDPQNRFRFSMYILFQIYFILKQFSASDINLFPKTIGDLGYEALQHVEDNLEMLDLAVEREQTKAVIKVVRGQIVEYEVYVDVGKATDKPINLGDDSTGSTTFP